YVLHRNNEKVFAKNEEALSYWKDSLSDHQLTDLPYDFQPPADRRDEGNYIERKLSVVSNKLLNTIARENKVSEYTVFVTSVYIFLTRLANQSDICLGMPVANRNEVGTENITGYFINSLPIRIRPENNNNSFRQLLLEINQVLLDSQEFEQISLETLIEKFSENRSGMQNPFFNVQVNQLALEEIDYLERIPYHNGTAKFDLTFNYLKTPNDLIKIGIEYSTELFADETIILYQNYLKSIIEVVCQSPLVPLQELELFADYTEALKTENKGNEIDYPKTSLDQLIVEQAKLTPNHIALVRKDKSVSYTSLLQQTDRMATYLQTDGVNAGDVVAVIMKRSIDMVVSFIAIMQAGATYMPIASDQPVERIAYMLDNSNCKAIVTDHSANEIISQLKTDKTAGSDRIIDPSENSQYGDHVRVESAVDPNSAAYIIYTSGSTGKPKGVAVSHQAIVNHMIWMKSEFEWNHQDVFLQKTAVTFDASVWEFYLPLLMGNTLVLSETGEQTNPQIIA
ncbi:MAG: AMP-binding protein, partial [Cyclobacteriaceae bacterium]